MDVLEAIQKRRAIRQYLPDPVNREDILAVLDAANRAPSGLNRQPWEFVVVTGEKIFEMGANYRSTLDEYLSHWDQSPMRDFITREGFTRFAETYGGAPVVIVVLIPIDEKPNFRKADLESASAAMENLLIAATALGLGTCWMTGPLRDESALRRILAIPDDREIVAVTPLGYPEKIPRAPARIDADLTQKVRWVG
ncbi:MULTISPECIES: nitroreductase family protein [unclassified Methanoregula]|uniref:nitroreductase family protein n=1 Tax=unclassified Methanoregula TaxID=2649730 RepID=UPI0009D3FE53|nr:MULTISPECIES: nitroreductase family protein [unclassified Methanoregula]OPX64305.1 MAG: putative oxidoreductase [Methanoregula sp. PtaB.Bin085]OPY33570.1 MAG: putative oxidoreductase [Methanoregula sp. PtaU1.Bin006]